MKELNVLDATDLKTRSRQILEATIQIYVDTAQPVSSKSIAKYLDIRISPATIRNEMAGLESMGLLDQPHHSAGRIPTADGFRFWIRDMVSPQKPNSSARKKLIDVLAQAENPQEGVAAISGVLSQLTRGAVIASSPSRDRGRLAKANFIRLDEQRVVLLWATTSGIVFHRTVYDENGISSDKLELIERILNDEFSGFTLDEIRSRIRRQLEDLKLRFDRVVDAIFPVSHPEDDRIILEGVRHVMEQPDFDDVGVLRRIYDSFEDRHRLSVLLERVVQSGGLRVLLAEDLGCELSHELSFVGAPYGTQQDKIGTIGVVGPHRMSYPQIIGLVQYAANLLGDAFEQRS